MDVTVQIFAIEAKMLFQHMRPRITTDNVFRTTALLSLGIQGLVLPGDSVQFNVCIHAITLRFCIVYVIRFHRLFEVFL